MAVAVLNDDTVVTTPRAARRRRLFQKEPHQKELSLHSEDLFF